MIETEIKAKVKNFTPIRKCLESLRFKKVRSAREVDIYYDHPMKDFRQTGEILRIRKSNRSTITYKGHVLSRQTKTRNEYQSRISSANEMSKILQSLGFKLCRTITKSRQTWESNGVTVNLDYVHSLGRFVEIEIISSDNQNTAYAEKQLFFIAGQLGLDRKCLTAKSYFELVQENS